jgi:excisionase family DNA binding protein
MEEWITVKEAAQIRNCTERNILKLIGKEELKAKKNGRRWLVFMDTSEQSAEQSPNSTELMAALKVQLQEKDDQISKLQQQLEEKDKQMERLHQLLAMEKTQTQQLLERQLLPFWKRWRRKQLPERTAREEE